jgi:hypothetical protein
MAKDLKMYKYCICDGVLVVFTEREGIAYFGEFQEVDEAEDTLNELCEVGVLCSEACLVEERSTTITDLMRKFKFFRRF